MTGLSHICNGDFRNEGWTLVGAAVSRLFHCWSNDDDSKYCKSPAHKGRACVSFPVDISTVPEGAVITSVTIFIRAAKIGSPARSITVNMSCLDDTASFTSRTIPLTTTPTTYEVGTYQRDPLGRPWDIHRLNKLLCQCFSYAGVFDCIRVYKLSCQINYRVRPTVTVENPTGTVLTPSPTISWTYAQADGDPQARAEYRVFTGIQQAESTFSPDTSPPVYSTSVDGDITTQTLPTSLNPDVYAVYVRTYSSFGAKSLWGGRTFTVQGPSPGVPGDDGTVSGTPGIGVVSVVPDSYSSSVSLTLRDSSNVLGVQPADFETLTDAPEYTTVNCAFVQDTSVYYAGVASGKLTASSAATMSVITTFVEVAAGAPVTARAQTRAAVTGRTVNLKIAYYDEAFTALLAETVTVSGTDSTSTWTEVVATDTVPDGAHYAKLVIEVVSPANAEVHNVDHVGLMYGSNAPWSDGGHSSRNILSSFSATGDDPSGSNWIAGTGSTISRVPVTGIGSHGTLTKRLTYTGITPSLAFRATGTAFTSPTSGTDYTLNKPAGVTTGDLMLAFVSSSQFGSIAAPAGWTAVNTAAVDDGSTDTALWVLKRTAGGSEPATWTDGSLDTASTRRYAVVVAYSGAADASQQFIAENVLTRASGTPLYLTSAVVTNTDANAWRVSAFAVSDSVTGGSLVANIAPPSASPAITYVGKGTVWGTTSNTTAYTINRPSNVVSGDLMVATIAVSDSVVPTVTAPAGWTLVRHVTQSDSIASVRLAVLKRTAGSSEPSSWSGTLSATVKPVVTQVSAYRNCDVAANQFLTEDTSLSGSGNTVTTATVSNTDSRSWRIGAFAASGDYATSWSTSEITERSDDTAEYWVSWSTYRTATLMMADSNGPVGTGSHSRTGSLGRSYYAAASWIGLIRALPSAPAPGANETERSDVTVGSADPWLTTGVYDSNGVIPIGATSVTGAFTPGSGTDLNSAASWIGIIRPAVPIVSGMTTAVMPDPVEISGIDPRILELAGNKVTFTSSFLGSTSGTPYLRLYFYRANELITSQVIQGQSFNTTIWSASSGTFDLPEGTTRIKGEVSVTDRAVSDLVYFDRVGILLGSDPVWRNGTGRTTHAVWSAPTIQYQDDDGSGYGDWQTLPGTVRNPPAFDALSGIATYTDHTVVPLTNRRYRAQTVSYGLAGDQFVSGYGPPSDEVSLTASNWWLKDIDDPTRNALLRVKWDTIEVGTTNTSVMYQPLGEDHPIVLTEGYKGDAFELTLIINREERAQLESLLRSGRTLFLQSDVDHAWWVRSLGDLKAAIQPTGQRRTNPIRFVTITFVQVAAEA